MNCLSHVSLFAATIFRRTGHFIPRSTSYGCYNSSWKGNFEHAGIKTINLKFALTTFHVQFYSSRKGGTAKASRLRKLDPQPVMEQEKDAFFVVRKGDVVGVYKSLSDCQAQVGSSICNPPISVYKGYSLPRDTEEYLVSHGLKNAIYTIRAADLKDDLFGTLMPCPFLDPDSTKDDTNSNEVSKKRSKEPLESEVVDANLGSATTSSDPLKKQIKLDHSAEAETTSSDSPSCILEFDGASKGNPGQAGAGAVLRADDGSVICKLREGLGIATNNVAEYRAMILGLRYAVQKGYRSIRIQGDSKLVCMQVQGLWKVKNKDMSELHKEAKKLKQKFLSFQINHVLRGLNSEADAQANLAIHLADGQVQEDWETEA